MDLTITWEDGTRVVPAPGRPTAYCPERFVARWSDGAHIDMEIGEDCIITSNWFLPEGLQGRSTREAWRERGARAIDGACWAVEQQDAGALSARAGDSIVVDGKPSRPRVTDEHLAAVAKVYREADKPHVAVAERFGLTQPNASQRIYEARRRGILEPSERGVAQPA
jgi:hypothetical protein